MWSGLSVDRRQARVLGGGVSRSAVRVVVADRIVIDARKMTVVVRYHKTELESEADYETFADADAFAVHGDNTLELRRDSEVIGFVHAERWDSVCTTQSADRSV